MWLSRVLRLRELTGVCQLGLFRAQHVPFQALFRAPIGLSSLPQGLSIVPAVSPRGLALSAPSHKEQSRHNMFCNLISERTRHHFFCIPVIRSTSPEPQATMKAKDCTGTGGPGGGLTVAPRAFGSWTNCSEQCGPTSNPSCQG